MFLKVTFKKLLYRIITVKTLISCRISSLLNIRIIIMPFKISVIGVRLMLACILIIKISVIII